MHRFIRQIFLGIVCTIILGIYASGLFTSSKSMADVSPCLPSHATPIPNKNTQVVGTFPCDTPTPTPRPTATPIPRPTPHPTRPPVNNPQPPYTPPGNPPPNNGNACTHNAPMTSTSCSCEGNIMDTCQLSSPSECYAQGGAPGAVQGVCLFPQGSKGCPEYCWGKPVIYLYPTHRMTVDVTLSIPGQITKSIPSYPTNGWKDILAYPNGRFRYQGNTYSELYYETAVRVKSTITNANVYQKSRLKEELSDLTTRLGFTFSEQEEFLSYWMPKLQVLRTSNISVSLLSKSEKDKVDLVNISPKPDTFLEYLFIFKPVTGLHSDLPGVPLPETFPARVGFTAVEWGGSITEE